MDLLARKILKGIGMLILLIVGLFFWIYPPPWKEWVINNPTKKHNLNLKMYFMNDRSLKTNWCGNLQYTNEMDCEFRILVTNSKSDTLYNRVTKAPIVSKYYKDIEFYIHGSKDISIQYIPVNVPKDAKLIFYFKNYSMCDF